MTIIASMVYQTSCNNTFVVLGYRNSYHGMSPVTMELTNMSSWKFQLPRLQGVQCVREATVLIHSLTHSSPHDRVSTLMSTEARGEEHAAETLYLK